MDETPTQKQARLRREKREKKILEGGTSRLDKITSLSGRPAPEPEAGQTCWPLPLEPIANSCKTSTMRPLRPFPRVPPVLQSQTAATKTEPRRPIHQARQKPMPQYVTSSVTAEPRHLGFPRVRHNRPRVLVRFCRKQMHKIRSSNSSSR